AFILPLTELAMAGGHNALNALAALALGEAAGLPQPAMVEALRHFSGLPHRMELLEEWQGVRWYNDSKATNVGATLAALRGVAGPVVLIAGGTGKEADFAPLRAVLAEKARAVVLLGRDAPLLEEALAGAVPLQRVADMGEAVAAAWQLARRGDQVLLSPACASLDMFENYEARGRAFREALRRLMS
ncbi:MAG: glutamate ligase domain-containing protein, partial [Gammaproteobacteria bacterium]